MGFTGPQLTVQNGWMDRQRESRTSIWIEQQQPLADPANMAEVGQAFFATGRHELDPVAFLAGQRARRCRLEIGKVQCLQAQPVLLEMAIDGWAGGGNVLAEKFAAQVRAGGGGSG